MLTTAIITLAITGNAVLLVILWRLSDYYRSLAPLIEGVLVTLTVVNVILGFIGAITVIMRLNEVLR